ncbi:MAG: murein biosynthesis integral membrane protein MurJ [Desulfuromonadales bacterium]
MSTSGSLGHSPAGTEKARITNATGVLTAATLVSRVAGLIRDMVVAAVFGAGLVTDAFFVAFTIPNLLRRFFAEGSLTAAFVPTFTDVLHREGTDEARQVLRICWTLLLLVLVGVTVLGILGSPWLVKLIGFGFAGTPGKLALTDLLNRLMFPYILFVSLVALFAGVLNVAGHFLLPALSPVVLNLAMIGAAFVLAPRLEEPITGLACGVLLGGLLQFLMQLPVLARYGYDLRPRFNFRHPAVVRIVTLMLPGLAGVAIYQINVVVTRLLASFLEQGSVSWLYYGQRLFEFPQGVFVVSLAQAVLPTISRQVTADDRDGFNESLRFALILILLVTIPAAAGLVLCNQAVYSLFFMRGSFTAFDVAQSAQALAWYAPGLLFVGISRVIVPCFYALKDTRTPVWVSFWTLLVNLLAGLLLMRWMGHAGLALALTLASVFNALVLLVLLSRRRGDLQLGGVFRSLSRILPAAIIMSLVVLVVLAQADWLTPGPFLARLALLTGGVGIGVLVYAVTLWVFGVREIHQAWGLLRERIMRRRG